MVRQIEAQELSRRLADQEPTWLLDVRQAWEHQMAALPNSQLIPLNELIHRYREIQAPAGALIVTYCHHGIRSLSAAALLDQLGFPHVASLAGGIDAWSCVVDTRVPRY
ncbi:MAG: rhodanese-like domain-containing protein [Gemmataceae bacterium]